eukprot:COSAG03_NODE_16286_length_406_cov_0.869707_1_plen_33_part_01
MIGGFLLAAEAGAISAGGRVVWRRRPARPRWRM